MRVVETFETESWTADLHLIGGPKRPALSVVHDGHVLTNAVNELDWSEEPVEILLCQRCMIPGCTQENGATVTRLGDQVLFTVPSGMGNDASWTDMHQRATNALWALGGIAFSPEAWSCWVSFGAPPPAQLPRTPRSALESAWRASAPHVLRTGLGQSFDQPMRETFLTTAPTEVADPKRLLRKLESWFAQAPDAPVEGQLVHPARDGATLVTLTFDAGASVEDWHAFVLFGDQVLPAFGPDLILMPA